MELWATIPNTEGMYDASNLGNIRTWKPQWKQRQVRRSCPKVLKTHADGAGYLSFNVFNAGSKKKLKVHQSVLLAFGFIRPTQLHECAHLNGIRTDNRLSNLKWVTRSVNHSHKVFHGTDIRGEKSPTVVISEICSSAIKEKILMGWTQKMTAEYYGVSRGCVTGIIHGKTWKHYSSSGLLN